MLMTKERHVKLVLGFVASEHEIFGEIWAKQVLMQELFMALSWSLSRISHEPICSDAREQSVIGPMARIIEIAPEWARLRSEVLRYRYSSWFAACLVCRNLWYSVTKEYPTTFIPDDLEGDDPYSQTVKIVEGRNFKKHIVYALSKASEETYLASKFVSDCGSFAMGMEESPPHVAATMLLRLTQFIAPKSLKKLINISGNLYEKSRSGVAEPSPARGRTLGKNVGTTHVADLAASDFGVKFARSVLDCEDTGAGGKGGPLVILLDSSASTTSHAPTAKKGERASILDYLKGAVIATLRIAQDRDVTIIVYASSIKKVSEDSNIESLIRCLSHEGSGGTEWVQPMAKAIEILGEACKKTGAESGTILHFTDGICDRFLDPEDDWASDLNKSKGPHKHVMVVLQGDAIIDSYIDKFQEISDKLILITSITDVVEGIKEAI